MCNPSQPLRRILVAGLRGGSGKTVVSMGLAAAWRQQGHQVATFKKGPDYIDAAWLSAAAGRPCRNLDLFLMGKAVVRRSFITAAAGADLVVVEGNRGLYDGVDAAGTSSTAELAKLLSCPVILVVDCTKATRTVAALILGCQRLDPDVPIRGVILNQTGGRRHVSLLRQAIVRTCELPVVGVIPRLGGQLFPERHLGLVPPQEHSQVPGALAASANLAGEYLDLDAIRQMAAGAPPLAAGDLPRAASTPGGPPMVRIGVFRDAAFQFYYPENLEALEREGAQLLEISPLRAPELPAVDALYIGGGFPETMAPGLSANVRFREAVRQRIEEGLPVYAECGGAVFLGEQLLMDDTAYPMAGVLPVIFAFGPRPQGHGYTCLEATQANPFYSVGDAIRGHEFHYTYAKEYTTGEPTFAFRVRRGHGFDGKRDGLCRWNVLACYTHVHALGVENWASSLVREAVRFGRASGAAPRHGA